MKLPPRGADDAPARGFEAAVADAVLLEGVRDRVVGAAVELDDEAGGGQTQSTSNSSMRTLVLGAGRPASRTKA